MRYGSPTFRGIILFAAAVVLSIPFSAQAQVSSVPQRIAAAIDETKLTTLHGNTHPLARPQFDRGPAPASLPAERMLLVLTRSPQQETGLETLLEQQQDAGSSNFHQWLTPQQFGQQFGPSDQDIQTITSWLQSHGFQVAGVSNGRTVIEFSGTAGQVQEAFHTSIHQYSVNGNNYWANSSDPQIPSALAPVVAGINTLYNFPRQQMHEVAQNISRAATGRKQAGPDYSFTCGTNNVGQPVTCYALAPADFAKIYTVPNLLLSPAPATQFNGDGVTIAIVGESEINTNDVAQFRSMFGLPALKAQQVNVIVNGPDPGTNGAETEADLDVEQSGAVAPNATIDLVLAEPTEVSLGVDLAAQYVVDNNLAAIINESFGVCEFFMGTTNNAFYNGLWQQAAAQGISVFVSTGDAGSAVCDGNLGSNGPAQFGLSVSGISSTPYNVAVGGTDFNDATDPLTFWNTSNNSTTLESAKGYIPELPWNNTCTNPQVPGFLGLPPSTTAEQMCNNTSATSQFPFLLDPVGGSGGKSGCTTSDFNVTTGVGSLSSCGGGYAKPSWQTKLTPADGKRDLPDVSLFASNGFNGNFYVICEADVPPGFSLGSCGTSQLIGLGGTSASSPSLAAIMALIDQATGSRQGNPNPILYNLASQSGNTCTSAANPASACVFYDVPSGFTIAMPCANGSPNCTVSAGDSVGVLAGYSTSSSYDLATGLGSVNANNLITNWKNFALTASNTSLTLNNGAAVNITHGQSVPLSISVSGTGGTPTGNVSLIANEGPNGTAGATDGVQGFVLSGGAASGTTSSLPGGSYSVFASYAGDGTFASSTSSPASVTVNPENSSANMQLELFDPVTGQQTNSNATTAQYGSLELLRMNITSQAGDTCMNNAPGAQGCPTGNVTIKNNGASLDVGTYVLNSNGYAEDQTVQLPGGTDVLSLSYPGDNSFNASSGTSTITITQAPTNTSLAGSTSSVFGSLATFTVYVTSTGIGAGPTGQITLFSGSTQIGGPASVSGAAGSLSNPNPNAQTFVSTSQLSLGNNSITAQYSGDGNYAASTSASFNVDAQIPTNCALTSSSFTINHGSSVTFTAQITPIQAGGPGPTGTVTFGTNNGTLGTVPLANGQAQVTTSSLPGGNVVVNAEYNGDTNYSASFNSVVETVNLLATTTSVSSSSSTVTQGQSVTLTSTIAPTQSGGPAPTGTVQFGYLINGGIDFFAIGTVTLASGQAQMTTTSLPLGSDQVMAVYSGDANYSGSASPTITVTVNPAPSFSISANPTTVAVSSPGQSGSTTLTFTGQNGFSSNGSVTITPTCTGLPSEASCTSGASVNIPANGSATAQVTFNTTAPSAVMPASRHRPDRFGNWTTLELVTLACLLCAIALLTQQGRKRRRWTLAAFLIAGGLVVAAAGCGGGSGGGGGGGGNPGTPPGVTNPTVSITINGVTETVNVSLNVE